MSTIDNLIHRATGIKRRCPFGREKLAVEFGQRQTGAEKPAYFATQAEFTLTLQIEASYWANASETFRAREAAEAMILQLLYDDSLLLLRRLRSSAFDGDVEEVLRLVDELEHTMTTRRGT